MEIEDLGRSVLQEETAKEIIDKLLSQNIKTKEEFKRFQKNEWKRLKLSKGFTSTELLKFYRELCKKDVYRFDKTVVSVLSKKNIRQKYGVCVVAQTLSPYPEIDLTKDTEMYNRLLNEDREKGSGGEFTCAWRCRFCPSNPGMPKSYDDKEPGIRRGLLNMFDPVKMMNDRLDTYYINGADPDKIEMIYLGGTLESFFGKKIYGEEYIEWFTKMSYYACNVYNSETKREPLSLKEERDINRYVKPSIIGLTLETRPDCVTKDLVRYRDLGCTRIQMGVQHAGSKHSNRILDRIERGCTDEDTKNAIKCCLRCGYKIDGHFMIDLPKPLKKGLKIKNIKELSSDDIDWDFDSVLADIEMYYSITYDPDYRFDQHKNYPTEVVPYSPLYDEYKKGLHLSYADKWYTPEELLDLYNYKEYRIIESDEWLKITQLEHLDKETYIDNFFSFMHTYVVKDTEYFAKNRKKRPTDGKFNLAYVVLIYVTMHTRRYVRINRTVRDIPSEIVIGGIKDSNTKQYLDEIMARHGWYCPCIRSRTVTKVTGDTFIKIIIYDSCGGKEYYIEVATETKALDGCVGYLRLRFDRYSGCNHKDEIVFPELRDCAMIRELHVFGTTTPKGEIGEHVQHKGFGTSLMRKAFEIIGDMRYMKVSVISGDGVKVYYQKKFAFKEEGRFLIKNFGNDGVNRLLILILFILVGILCLRGSTISLLKN